MDLPEWVEQQGSHQDGGLIESEDGAEEGGGLLVRIKLKVGMAIGDESRADDGEQTRLQE